MIGGALERSRANGPGERFVVWLKGCALACPGCFNPHLWDPEGGEEVSAVSLAARIHAVAGLRGVTLSGGEPLEQPEAVLELLSLLNPRLDTVIFTGFSLAEIQADPRKAPVLTRVDLLVAGRYLRERDSDHNPWAGSSNKEVHALTGRIGACETPEARVELFIGPDGVVTTTGFPTPDLLKHLKT